jgi:hypothetical protein
VVGGWRRASSILSPCFLVTEADAATIRSVFNQEGGRPPRSRCAAGSLASPTARRPGHTPGPSPDGNCLPVPVFPMTASAWWRKPKGMYENLQSDWSCRDVTALVDETTGGRLRFSGSGVAFCRVRLDGNGRKAVAARGSRSVATCPDSPTCHIAPLYADTHRAQAVPNMVGGMGRGARRWAS